MPTSTDTERVPRVIDEALFQGLTVVSTSIGGIKTEFSDGSIILVEPGDPIKLYKGLVNALQDKSIFNKRHALSNERISRILKTGPAYKQHLSVLKCKN
jgi:hypothetical protein